MHSPDSIIGFRSRVADHGESPRLWGHDPVELHDHFWRQIGVEVVRPGTRDDAAGVDPVGQGLGGPAPRIRGYLLLGIDELTAFGPASALKRIAGRRRRSLQVDLIDPAAGGIRERIEADERDTLVSIERRYDAPAPRGTVLLSSDRRLADWWRRSVHPARHPRAATAVDRASARRRVLRHQPVAGLLEDADDPQACIRWLETMLRLDPSLAGTVPGVSAVEPGVWAHDSARIGPNVSLAGPLWIGEHVVLEGNASVVGPRMMLDDAPRLGGVSTAGSLRRTATAAAGGVAAATATRTRRGGLLRRLLGRGRTHGVAEAFATAESVPTTLPVRPEPRSIRVFNIIVSGAVLTAVLPLFPLIMLAIRLEDGRPFFFGHVRQTRGGRNFTCWKFRTMCRDAERMKAMLERENVCDGPQFHIADDPRLLKVGRLLRRFHLDELPQLWNVLRGDMNLVGPRPSPDEENQYCPAWREARLSVKPGLTGLWQIRRTRAPMADFQELIRWYMEYVERRSWRLDLWIMWRTAVGLVHSRGVPAPVAASGESGALASLTGFQPPMPVRSGGVEVLRPSDGLPPARTQEPPVIDTTRIATLGLGTSTRHAAANDAAVRRAARPAGRPSPKTDPKATPVPGEVEAKPRQPVHDPEARGTQDLEAKPRLRIASPSPTADADGNVTPAPEAGGPRDPDATGGQGRPAA
jgi:lipopolysaccharide/colanic/teichoic acid biosynthesis glycosyltransferase